MEKVTTSPFTWGKRLLVGSVALSMDFIVFCRNCSNPKIKGAVVFHGQGPHIYDYSLRLNHTWAFSGFPDPKSIMDTNGPFVNDLQLGVNIIPTTQYSSSGFFTVCSTIPTTMLRCLFFHNVAVTCHSFYCLTFNSTTHPHLLAKTEEKGSCNRAKKLHFSILLMILVVRFLVSWWVTSMHCHF